ncbi:MAG TPA: hypothetical protein VET65_11080 [Candidatus Limnocylindrales bacterium]|nr:hypothetical protein [Candidatus Limnocylindrales bacterium]
MISPKLRVSIVSLELFLAASTIAGAVVVVPTLPVSWITWGPFADYTIPALALGVLVGGGSLLALAASLRRHPLAGPAAVAAGGMIAIFEVVEMAVIGPVFMTMPSQPAGWLQLFYFFYGLVLASLGLRLWITETPRETWTGRLRHTFSV